MILIGALTSSCATSSSSNVYSFFSLNGDIILAFLLLPTVTLGCSSVGVDALACGAVPTEAEEVVVSEALLAFTLAAIESISVFIW